MADDNKLPRVLLVEDEAIIALDKARTLESFGYAVKTAHSGVDAVETVAADPAFDLIIMDIDLGFGMDGTEAAERILERHEIPVLFMSSHSEPEIVERTERITSYGYVIKSSAPTVLSASIKMAFKLHHAHEMLRAERTNLEAMMDASPYGMLVVDGRLRVIRANPAAEEISGRTLASMEQPRCGDFLGCVSRLRVPYVCGETEKCPECTLYADIRATLADGTASPVRESMFELAPRDGGDERRIAWLRFNLTPVTINGELSALITLADITDERTGQERLRLLSTIAESESNMVVITDAERRITWVNESFATFTGYRLSEIAGRNPGHVLQGTGTDRDTTQRMTRAFDAGEPYQCDILNYTRSGRPYWIHLDVQPIHDDAGTLTHFVSIQHDITERRRYEQKLLEQDARKRSLVEDASDGIVAVDARGTIVYANRSYERISGLARETVRGMTSDEIFALVHPDHATELRARIRAALDEGAREMVYRFLYRADGEGYVWREDRAKVFYADDGTLDEMWVMARLIGEDEDGELRFEVLA